MAKTASISLRIEPAVKAQLEALYASFGISVTDAINIFLHTSLMEGGFPFQPKQPRYNAETEAAIQETKDILAGKIRTTRKTGGLLTGYKPVVLGQRLKALAFTTFKPHSH